MVTIPPQKPELEEYKLTNEQYTFIKDKANQIKIFKILNSDLIFIKVFIAIIIIISIFIFWDILKRAGRVAPLPIVILFAIYTMYIVVKGVNLASKYLEKRYINYRLYQINGYKKYVDYENALVSFEYKKDYYDREQQTKQEQLRLKKEREFKRRQHQFWMSLDPYDLEKEIAVLFKKQGYVANVTKGSGDGGIDILIEKEGLRGIVQCKRFKNKVGPGPIRDLYGTMKAGNHKFGIAVCPSGFSDQAYEFSKGKNIKLIGLKQIMEMVD